MATAYAEPARLTPGYIATIIFGVVLTIVGALLLIGGIWLMILGGSFYYAIAGAGLVVTAILLMLRSMLGVWVYVLTYAFTLGWAYWEVGFDLWAQVPRVVGPTVVLPLVVLCIPVLRNKGGR